MAKKISDQLEFVPVKSSQIKGVNYDSEKKILTIIFRSKESVWTYYPITEDGYKDFMAAESLGQYFHKHIKFNENITPIQVK